MANVLVGATGAPIFLDTVGSTSLISTPLFIQAIVWSDPTTTGHTVVLHDAASGNVVFQATCSVAKAGESIVFPKPISVKGLYLTTLGSGIVLVYLA